MELAVELGMAGADMTQTCWHLANTPGWRERWLPTQNCASAVGMTAGFIVAAELGGYWLHRHGHHLLEQVPRLYMTSTSARGIAYSVSH